MRVTESMLYRTTTTSLSQAMDNLQKVAEKVASTKRLNRPSDDPADVRSAIKLRDSLAELDQFARNVDTASRWVSTADTSLGNATETMQRANELALEGANGSVSAGDRATMAQEVEQLSAALVTDAAAKVGDQYIFSGFQVDRPPFATIGPATVGAYQGDNGALLARVGPDSTVQTNLTADQAFKPALDALAQLHADLTTGTGVVQQSTLGQLTAGLQKILDQRSVAGARANRLDETKTSQDSLVLDSQALLSNLEDVDMAEAITELTKRQATYDAALKVNGRVMQSSLIDYLR